MMIETNQGVTGNWCIRIDDGMVVVSNEDKKMA